MVEDELLGDKPVRRRWLPRFGGGAFGGHWLLRAIKWTLLTLIVLFLLYYPIGILLVESINDDPAFSAPSVQAGTGQTTTTATQTNTQATASQTTTDLGTVDPAADQSSGQAANARAGASQAVATVAALIDREVNGTIWAPNEPFFLPGGALDNMPNFQLGEITAIARFVLELQDQIGRNRGTSGVDADLKSAVGALNYKPDVWVWSPTVSLWPTATTEEQYRQGMRSLLNYNRRLAAGQAAFERRADNLLTTLDRIGKDLGSATDEIDREITNKAGDWVDFQGDDLFYRTKGLLYGNALILRDLGKDFAVLLRERGSQQIWDRMVDSMAEGAALRPTVVINGLPDSLIQPSHLAAQGFYLIRARAQLEELNDILQK